jgi:hypothetical protein
MHGPFPPHRPMLSLPTCSFPAQPSWPSLLTVFFPGLLPLPAVPLENPLYDPIQAPEEVPLALHATSPEKWVQGRLWVCGMLQDAMHPGLHVAAVESSPGAWCKPVPPFPACCHSWERIQASGELRRMSRTHIHLASQPKHLRGNDWASVLLQARPAQPAAFKPACRRVGCCCWKLDVCQAGAGLC